jgi:hypothetical protein
VKDDYTAWHDLCASLVPYGPSVIALSEPNIDFLQQDVRQKIESIFQLHFGSVRLVTATSCAKAASPWKPGGALLAVLGQWTQHVTTTSRNDLGRWVSATLSGSDGTHATIYSCYNVVNTTIANVGPSTVFAQQYQLLRLAGNPQSNPCRQFAEDLETEEAARRRNHEELIICGDFNERLGDDPNLISTVCATCDFFDVHDRRLGDVAQVPTYIHGSTKLDHVFTSLGLDRHVTSCGLNLLNEHFTSDHRVLFTEFSLAQFLGTTLPAIVRSDLRFISSDSANVAKLIGKTYSHLNENKAFHLYQDFLLDADLSATPW